MSDVTEENSYRNILKRISAFGGVQLFSILISLVRGKFVAMFLGPEGMGISSLYTSATNSVQQISSLGLNLALVKEAAAGKDDRERLPHIFSVAIRLITFTALLGGIVCILLSPLLSMWTFGNTDYTVGFVLLSLSVSLSIAGAGYLSLLQGMGEVRRLAKASLVGGLTGLCCGVPLYYLFGYDGIVPGMIILSATSFLFYFISFRRCVSLRPASFNWQRHKPLVKRLLTVGLVLMLGSLSGTLTNYIINAFIRHTGSVEDVGLFQAANSLTNQYVGLIFSALALDYFPRLAAAKDDLGKFGEIINRQIEIVSLIITPLLLILILTAPLVIRILLTDDFLASSSLIRWLGLGVMMQAVAFPIGYAFIAQNNNRLYIWNEIVITNILWLVCSVLFYRSYGLIGLGISLVVRSLIGDGIAFGIVCKYYRFRLSGVNKVLLSVMFTMVATAFLASYSEQYGYLIITPLIIFSLIFSLVKLKRRL
ncbi:MAG: oligosaccharide flippase family protein [Muribaculaceae bacterium]|nr:oligosaccharide flippase family protein [Muribaculaceae bacterium]